MKERLILKTILLFFLPLLFRSELIQLSHAMAMNKRRTILITYATAVRLVGLIGFFAFLDPHLNGAVLGVFSFAGAFAAETILLGWHLWHQSQKHKTLFDLRGASL
jgi:hypothetical protein